MLVVNRRTSTTLSPRAAKMAVHRNLVVFASAVSADLMVAEAADWESTLKSARSPGLG